MSQFKIGDSSNGGGGSTDDQCTASFESSICNRLESLPVEVIQKILVSLPLSSIIRCKLLSKPFSTVVDDQRFALEHFSISAKNNPFIFLAYKNSIYFLELDSLDISESTVLDEFKKISLPYGLSDTFLLGSCNGYVCVAGPRARGDCVATFVWNPVTGHHVDLPSLAKECYWGYGFGFHPVTREYKVVMFCFTEDTDGKVAEQYIQVLTLGASRWRCLEAPSNISMRARDRTIDRGVCLDGTMHWLGEKHENEYVSTTIILTFDLATEELKEIPLPDNIALPSRRFENLLELGGCLALVIFNYADHLDIWVMEGSWRLKFVIGSFGGRVCEKLYMKKWGEFKIPQTIPLSHTVVVCFLKSDKMLITFPLGGMLCYDFSDDTFMDFDIRGLPNLKGWPYEYEALAAFGSLIRMNLTDWDTR